MPPHSRRTPSPQTARKTEIPVSDTGKGARRGEAAAAAERVAPQAASGVTCGERCVTTPGGSRHASALSTPIPLYTLHPAPVSSAHATMWEGAGGVGRRGDG